MHKRSIWIASLLMVLAVSGCSLDAGTPAPPPTSPFQPTARPVEATPPPVISLPTQAPSVVLPEGETAQVTNVIDGDTIDVSINGSTFRVRYIGINTPERNEPCYREATDANAALVRGQTLRLVRDVSNVDRFGRLLRYIYRESDGLFVNEVLVRDGWAEGVEYAPDRRHTAYFRTLEAEAMRANRGCHPTGIFNDGSDTR